MCARSPGPRPARAARAPAGLLQLPSCARSLSLSLQSCSVSHTHTRVGAAVAAFYTPPARGRPRGGGRSGGGGRWGAALRRRPSVRRRPGVTLNARGGRAWALRKMLSPRTSGSAHDGPPARATAAAKCGGGAGGRHARQGGGTGGGAAPTPAPSDPARGAANAPPTTVAPSEQEGELRGMQNCCEARLPAPRPTSASRAAPISGSSFARRGAGGWALANNLKGAHRRRRPTRQGSLHAPPDARRRS